MSKVSGVLTDYDIKGLKNSHNIIEPFEEQYLQPCSYDVHFDLHRNYIVPPLAMDKQLDKVNGGLKIPPQTLVLISTKERVFVPNGIVGELHGKSSLGRIGLNVHITAGFLDSGFHGNVTLELYSTNDYPIVLKDNCPIGQLVFKTTTGQSVRTYNEKDNHYQHQAYTTPSRYEMCFDGDYYVIEGE